MLIRWGPSEPMVLRQTHPHAGGLTPGQPRWQAAALELDVAYREWVHWFESVTQAGSWERAEREPTSKNKENLTNEVSYLFYSHDVATRLAREVLRETTD